MRSQIFLWILSFWISIVVAQKPVVKVDFENDAGINTVPGISGKAFDLGPNSSFRYALAVSNPLRDTGQDLTVMLWVKSPEKSRQQYDILSSLILNDDTYSGWKISVQPDGAWMFHARMEDVNYEYLTTVPRQSIRDGDWHLLAVTYESLKNELSFYFDGKLMAIYNAPGIDGFYTGETIVVGNSLDSEFSRVTGEMTESRFVLTEWDSFNGWIDEVSVYSSTLDARSVSSYYHKITGKKLQEESGDSPDVFKLTTFNIWHGGNRFGKEVGKQRLIEVLKQTNSDAYLIIETYGSGPEIADALGYYLYLISTNLSIFSRYPINETYSVFEPFHSGGMQVSLPDGHKVNLFCIWLSSQPQYFIKGLTPDEAWTKDKYLEEENKTRGIEMNTILTELAPLLKITDSIPIIVGGDFNSGSHLDWIEETAEAHNGYSIPWPVSKAMKKAGLKDSFRELHPDPIKEPGITWSPIRSFPLKDRIDFIYYKGVNIEAIHSEVLDQHPVGFPSDHAGVSTEFKLIW